VEQEQRRVVREYTEEAHRRGISVMALLPSPEAATRTVKLAAEAGLDGLVLDGQVMEAAQIAESLPIIQLPANSAVPPGIRVLSKDGAVQATPTSEP
jgi:hypothetical protein